MLKITDVNGFIKQKWRGYLINLVILIVVVVGIRVWQHRNFVSGVAPALQESTISGLPYVLPEKPISPMIVHFWGTWCPICRAEQNNIEEISRTQNNVITIAMDSGNKEDVARFMKQNNLSFPVINDKDGILSRSWGVNAVPASFILDMDGKIRFAEVGYTTSIGLRIRLWLAGL